MNRRVLISSLGGMFAEKLAVSESFKKADKVMASSGKSGRERDYL